MISPKFFIDKLEENNINFFTGVPDSLLKNICAYIEDNKDENHNIIAANEGAAMGLATGHYLATGEIPVVYMQNSGEGNIINPLASLTDKEVYNIPILLIIGWRGRPGVHDEPQHIKQGKVTLPLLETMGIKYTILSKDENEYGVPDIDSTPDNNKDGEDDQDEALVLLSINTGSAPLYITLITIITAILGTGAYLIYNKVIKK